MEKTKCKVGEIRNKYTQKKEEQVEMKMQGQACWLDIKKQ